MFNDSVKKFETTRAKHVATLQLLMNNSLASFSLSRDELKALQLKSLRKIVDYAKQSSPWHQQRLKHVNSEDITWDTIHQLPTMSKADVMENWDDIVTNPTLNKAAAQKHVKSLQQGTLKNPYFKNEFMIQSSGGSSGHPIIMPYDWDEWAIAYLSFIRPSMANMNQSENSDFDPNQTFHAATLGTNSLAHMSCALGSTFAMPQLVTHRFDRFLPMNEVVAQLNEIDPISVSGYPSFLYSLAQEAMAGRLKIKPMRLYASSEPLYPYIAEAIKAAWGSEPGNSYVTTESACVGWSCPITQKMHLNEDLHYVESLTEGGILITNLFHKTLPLIRYEMSDNLVMSDESCECGTKHGTILSVGGRTEDEFHYGNGIIVPPLIFIHELENISQLGAFQVSQTTHGAHIKVICDQQANLQEVATKLIARLNSMKLHAPEVTIERVEYIEPTAVGKIKAFKAL